jgi:hypothetical protein
MKCFYTLILLAFATAACFAAAPAKKTNPITARRSIHSTGKVKYVRGRNGKWVRVRATAGPTYQLHPDPERYQQIQQALADKGYFKGQVNGEWGDDSIDALKRFQADQKLDNDGHLNALTLTGLGLGPKHDPYVPLSGGSSH